MVATAAWCSRVLATERFDLALNVGLCGSFVPDYRPGAVVHVASDCIAELGAQDGDDFLSIHDLNLLDRNAPPFADGWLVNTNPPANAALASFPSVRGITVNTVHGHEAAIGRAMQRFAPDVESMEGAAFMYACLIHGQPFAQLRAVSNIVERRNRAAWKIGDAVRALAAATESVIAAAAASQIA